MQNKTLEIYYKYTKQIVEDVAQAVLEQDDLGVYRANFERTEYAQALAADKAYRLALIHNELVHARTAVLMGQAFKTQLRTRCNSIAASNNVKHASNTMSQMESKLKSFFLILTR